MVVGCQPYAPVAFTPRKCSWYSFLLEAESTPVSMKNPVTLVGIEPATFRFVAQHLNHCATAAPQLIIYLLIYSENDRKHIITLCGQIQDLLMLPRVEHNSYR